MAISKLKIDFSSTVTLNDGVEMPLFGIGFDFEKSDDEEFNVETAVISALQIGYRMIDTCNRLETHINHSVF
jgi:diketogulonate reductase-like aldo/keto reductase